jgi:NAD(P)-dependent dehydrogenase (short-subunit alcohol dehydrogenase family)
MPTIVMTGGTAGIGAVAARHLEALPGARLIMGARAGAAPADAERLPLDLASLASVRAFAAAVAERLGDAPIDALLLNAGGRRPDVDTRSADGFELTFATNHLAHHALLRLLLPRLAEGARVVITTSDTHDPAEKTGVPPPHHADARLLAHPEHDARRDASATTAGLRAYAASKLCNLLTARALALSPEAAARQLIVVAYNPGLTPGTRLARDHSWAVRRLAWPLLPLLLPFARFMNSLADAGRSLAELASTITPPAGRVYASLRKGRLTWPDPSELARDDMVMRQLWDDSVELAGLST